MKPIKAVILYLFFLFLYVPVGVLIASTVYSALDVQFRGQPFRVAEVSALLPLNQPIFLAVVALVVLYGAYAVAKNPDEKLWGKGSKRETVFGLLALPVVLAVAKFVGSY